MNRAFVLRNDQSAASLYAFLKSNWRAMADEGKPIAVLISEHKARRNGDQNRLYWNQLGQIAEQARVEGKQFSKEAWHAHFAGMMIGWEDMPNGMKVPISSTTLNVAEFSYYLAQVQRYATAELGLTLE